MFPPLNFTVNLEKLAPFPQSPLISHFSYQIVSVRLDLNNLCSDSKIPLWGNFRKYRIECIDYLIFKFPSSMVSALCFTGPHPFPTPVRPCFLTIQSCFFKIDAILNLELNICKNDRMHLFEKKIIEKRAFSLKLW